MSETLHTILEPDLSFFTHILKYSFDFEDRLDKNCDEKTLLRTCDINTPSLYTPTQSFFKPIEY